MTKASNRGNTNNVRKIKSLPMKMVSNQEVAASAQTKHTPMMQQRIPPMTAPTTN